MEQRGEITKVMFTRGLRDGNSPDRIDQELDKSRKDPRATHVNLSFLDYLQRVWRWRIRADALPIDLEQEMREERRKLAELNRDGLIRSGGDYKLPVEAETHGRDRGRTGSRPWLSRAKTKR